MTEEVEILVKEGNGDSYYTKDEFPIIPGFAFKEEFKFLQHRIQKCENDIKELSSLHDSLYEQFMELRNRPRNAMLEAYIRDKTYGKTKKSGIILIIILAFLAIWLLQHY